MTNTPEYNREYYLKNITKFRNKTKKWKEENPELYKKSVRAYYELNKERINNRIDKYREKSRILALDYYSNSKNVCNCCGENELRFLCIDHIDNNGNTHRKEIGKVNFFVWLKRNNYPDGFQVLCFNCNMGKHLNGGTCPHKNCLT